MSYRAVWEDVHATAMKAEGRYGDFASAHEALGVACEEWQELIDAIRSNNMSNVRAECIDLAAVCVRLAAAIDTNAPMRERSGGGR